MAFVRSFVRYRKRVVIVVDRTTGRGKEDGRTQVGRNGTQGDRRKEREVMSELFVCVVLYA